MHKWVAINFIFQYLENDKFAQGSNTCRLLWNCLAPSIPVNITQYIAFVNELNLSCPPTVNWRHLALKLCPMDLANSPSLYGLILKNENVYAYVPCFKDIAGKQIELMQAGQPLGYHIQANKKAQWNIWWYQICEFQQPRIRASSNRKMTQRKDMEKIKPLTSFICTKFPKRINASKFILSA